MSEIPFLRMVRRHRLTASVRGVMIEASGIVQWKAGLVQIRIFATAAIILRQEPVLKTLVAIVVDQKSVPAG
ncbi:MAG: hypothetical protein DWI29_02915 [Planctomycetota bacterium]|nr:MAG: hypothetical protein DWI29_02915 [Planctomycetota bacterium]